MSDAVIQARGLVKRYGRATAVDGIDLDINQGEIFGLLGPNGAGKTTVILMLLGLTEITAGSVDVLGFDPARQPLEVKRRIAYLPDAVGFYDNFTAAENLRYVARLAGIDPREAETRIAEALAQVRLDDRAKQKVATFSRGMRQRLGLAEIWLKRARIAILDEPTSGLDPQSTNELLDMIRALKGLDITVLLSSHLLDRVQVVCDRVALFNRGKVALLGTVAELARNVLGGGSIVEVQATGPDMHTVLSKIPGVRHITQDGADRFRLLTLTDIRGAIAAGVIAGGGTLTRLAVEQPSLDAVYNSYFKDAAHAA